MIYYVVIGAYYDYDAASHENCYVTKFRFKAEDKIEELKNRQERRKKACDEYFDWVEEFSIFNWGPEFNRESVPGMKEYLASGKNICDHPEYIKHGNRRQKEMHDRDALVSQKQYELGLKFDLNHDEVGGFTPLEYEIEEIGSDDNE